MTEEKFFDFQAKVTNMIIQYLTGIMKNDISEVRHFLLDQPVWYANKIISTMKEKNRRKMFDELNVSNIKILEEYMENSNTIFVLSALIKYLDYEIDLNSGEIYGNNNYRINKIIKMKIIINNNKYNYSHIKRCPSCGKSLDTNYNGKCDYCGNIFNQKDYDYQILEFILN